MTKTKSKKIRESARGKPCQMRIEGCTMAKLGSEPLVSYVLHFFLEARSRSSSFGLVSGSSDSRVQLKIANVITPVKMAFE